MEKAAEGIVFDRTVEVGPEVNSTVQTVAETIIRMTGSDSKVVNLPMRPGENVGDVVKADTSTLALVDMSADTLMPLEEGMQQTVDYFREHLKEEGFEV